MELLKEIPVTERYKVVAKEKSSGATYTPRNLADFVAQQIIAIVRDIPTNCPLRLLDPAVGDGELLVSLLEHIPEMPKHGIEVYGFDTNQDALNTATARIRSQFPDVVIKFEAKDFLNFVLEQFGGSGNGDLFCSANPVSYDLVIANPPYVRTQIMGATQAQLLAGQFGLSGRVDLYYAFILAISQVLKPQGVLGIIVSNRFMSTKSGASVRKSLIDKYNIRHAWDLGDTKVFDAAVLPAVLLAEGKNGHKLETPAFTTIYQTSDAPQMSAIDAIDALEEDGVVQIDDGRSFRVQHGKLDTGGITDGVWRITTNAIEDWLTTVKDHSRGTFGDIGKIRVGVKTCADKVFIRSDWQDMPDVERPELLKPLITHHVSRRFKSLVSDTPKEILYPHHTVQGKRQVVDISDNPRSKAYLEQHRSSLEGRKYVIEAGRKWYEVWVPQDPAAWEKTKLVFRDISEQPTFWIDNNGSVVNGDCYWLISKADEQTDLLWLAAAVGNSTFIEQFYDYRFNNKLYAGRRRFITQYVEKFPLPNPGSNLGKTIIAKAKQIYEAIPSSETAELEKELDEMVWDAFGFNS